MKPTIILFVAHLLSCGVVTYYFHERTETHQTFNPPIDTTTPDERARNEGSFLMSHSEATYTMPNAVIIYGIAGIIGLLIALGFEVFHRFSAHA